MVGEASNQLPKSTSAAQLCFGVVLTGLACLVIANPSLVAKRFALAHDHEAAVLRVLRAAGPALLAVGFAALLARSRWLIGRSHAFNLAFAGLAICGYVSLTTCLADWLVDDAAITFAYSKNLALGHGLVIHPSHVPEEGYSNTLWMLLLAGSSWLGADIAATAKTACVLFGAVAATLSFVLCSRAPTSGPRFGLLALGMTVCLGAPFLVWSSSGLEHSLQAALLAAIAAAPLSPRYERVVLGSALSALILLRPEAPLVVALVGVVLTLRTPAWGPFAAAVRRYWPVLAAPTVTYLALAGFRFAYFHDLFPNPYYAKASSATWLRLFNFVGGGWGYVTDWLSDSRAWLVVPLVMITGLRRGSISLQLAVALCVGQLGFVLFAGGDWMACSRFVAPALPVLAVVVVHSAAEAGSRWSKLSSEWGLLALVWLLGIGTLTQLITFRAHPTTPTAIVGQIGKTFVELGHRLGIEHPSLAHHDAGGTSYEAGIELLDLGGLGDRAVSKHMNDAEFMRKYIFEVRRPTFIFGSNRTFAAGATEFYKMAEFQQYVSLKFPNLPFMNADLCHVRRDAIHEGPGIRRVEEGGKDYWVVE